MKNSFTYFRFFLATIILFGVARLDAQIVDLDESKYYMLRLSADREGNEDKHAIGVPSASQGVNGALLEQQMVIQSDFQLWQFIQIDDSIYRVINKGSGMALGISDWPAAGVWGDDPAPQIFDWNGQWPGLAQRTNEPDDNAQEWIFAYRGEGGDTTYYAITNVAHLDSMLLSMNLWAHSYGIGFSNMALFDVNVAELDRYLGDGPSNYHVFLTKTDIDVSLPTSLSDILRNRINMFTSADGIVIRGDIVNKSIEVYSVIGSLVYKGRASSSEMNINVNRGVYIVRTGDVVNKLVVH